ncbi:hypothetical protein [Methylocaldum marinum]|uniref:hypothetical protein n=1 Tax=Methylocaldum marinum TaxID=1432792 RepID=UPI0011AE6B2D|nr:hypothetical protein [Methylocaldum marinum]
MNHSRFIVKAAGMSAALLITAGSAMADVEFIGVDPEAALSESNTVATVTGSVVCSTGESFTASAAVLQNVAGSFIAGSSQSTNQDAPSFRCTGESQAFSVNAEVVLPPGGSFQVGNASVILNVSAIGAQGTNSRSASSALRLK